jgi:D-alanyl-D-alanine carboxypeptidase
VATRILGIVIVVVCSVGGMGASTTALKPFDPVALQDNLEATAKELMLPGAMVLLHTPQGDFVFGYGSTELGVTIPPSATSGAVASHRLLTPRQTPVPKHVQR